MNPFDSAVLHFINQFVQKSRLFDNAIEELSQNLLLNGGIITALLWALWARRTPRQERNRSFVIAGVVLTVVALAVARTLALFLPYRERPRFSPALGLRIPVATSPYAGLIHWSSFPSDHAVLYFALATTVFFVSRKIGLFAYFHAAIVVCFPLLYLGIHYPTDLICGALIGGGIACLALNDSIREGIARPALHWCANSPATFYPAFYLWSVLTATEFDSVRSVALDFWKILKRKL